MRSLDFSDISDSEEGAYESISYSDFIDNRQNNDPTLVNYNTWIREVGGLIRSENHVLMDDDEQLRSAITQAMFLETASENLLRKRKRQIEVLDELRGEEGDKTLRLFEDVKGTLKDEFGPHFGYYEQNISSAVNSAKRPVKVVDTSQPPPSMVQLPPMSIPPPSTPKNFVQQQPISSIPQLSPAINQSINLPCLISQHLVPPPIASKIVPKKDTNWSDEPEKEHEEHRNDKAPFVTGVSSIPAGVPIHPWRRTTPSFHPTPQPPPPSPPPPSPAPFLSSRLPFTPFQRLSLSSIPLPAAAAPQSAPTAIRRSFNGERAALLPTPLPPPRPISPPGLVGVNVRGLFVGGPLPKTPTTRRHSFGHFKR